MNDLIEFVITIPEPFGVELAYNTRTRTTLGVLTQLIAGAHQKIVLAAPFIQPERSLMAGPLAEALQAALLRRVQIDIVSTGQSLQSLRQVNWLNSPHRDVRFFQAKTNVDQEQRLGSHAKFCIADETSVYVGSANLTGPGLSEHLEMGFLVEGKHAKQIADFWNFLVDKGFWLVPKYEAEIMRNKGKSEILCSPIASVYHPINHFHDPKNLPTETKISRHR